MILVVDIGNTNLTLGIYDKNVLVKTFRLNSDINALSDFYAEKIKNITKGFKIKGCIIGSVVNELEKTVKVACDKIFGIESLILNYELKLNVKLDTKNPASVGADRIANVCAAYGYYNSPVIVVDLGSATTFDIVSKDGKFFGGVIMPGLKMQLKSLKQNTSKLPEIEVKDSEFAIGVDTESCILSGVIRGSACAIEGLIRQCEKELGEKATVVLTGGYSEFILKYFEKQTYSLNKTLTLEGLKKIYELNENNANI